MKQSNNKPKCARSNSIIIYFELNVSLWYFNTMLLVVRLFYYVPDVSYIPFIKWKQMGFSTIIERKIYMKNTQMHTAVIQTYSELEERKRTEIGFMCMVWRHIFPNGIEPNGMEMLKDLTHKLVTRLHGNAATTHNPNIMFTTHTLVNHTCKPFSMIIIFQWNRNIERMILECLSRYLQLCVCVIL